MRRVPSCLLFASLALALGALIPEGALAQFGFKQGPAMSSRAWSGPKGFHRGHWSRPHGFGRHRGYAGHLPAFHGHRHGFYRHGFPGFGRYGHHRSVYGPYGYPRYSYGRQGYGGYGYGRHGYGHSGSGRYFYGQQGYGRHFYSRHGYGHHGYGRRGYGFFPHSTSLWPSLAPYGDPTVIVAQGDALPNPATDIPSVADLPVLAGIRSAPVAAPAVYVLGSGKRSLRSGGAKTVSMGQGGEASGTGPLILRLEGPRGR